MDSDNLQILSANAEFYRAFEALDFDAMASIWNKDTSDICIHPGWEILHGWDEVRESWRAIFAAGSHMRFQLTEVVIVRIGDLARVTCVENLHAVNEGISTHARIAATNLWLLTANGWKLSLHHGSPMAHTVEMEEEELLN
jgi:ketosteroid isomerase-like protein